MTISTFFATPFYRVNEEDGVLAADITRCCLDMQTEEFEKPDPPQGKIPGVFESNFNFLDHSAGRIQDLRLLIQKHLVSFLAVINDSKPEDIAKYRIGYHSWFHITTRGGYFRAHTHPLASWSVVYCASRGTISRISRIIWGISYFTIPGKRIDVLDPTTDPCAANCPLIPSKLHPARAT